MKELKIVQNDDGKITVESTGDDGNPLITEAGSVDEAIDQIKNEFEGDQGGESEPMGDDMPGEMPMEENGPIAASKGKKLEDKLPLIDKKKKGANSRSPADWKDYSGL